MRFTGNNNLMQNQAPNHAKISINDNSNIGQAEVSVNGDEIKWLHAQTDRPGAEFDVVLYDKAGNEQFRQEMKGETNRYGAQINLPILDNYYIIKAENVKGAKNIDIFLE